MTRQLLIFWKQCVFLCVGLGVALIHFEQHTHSRVALLLTYVLIGAALETLIAKNYDSVHGYPPKLPLMDRSRVVGGFGWPSTLVGIIVIFGPFIAAAFIKQTGQAWLVFSHYWSTFVLVSGGYLLAMVVDTNWHLIRYGHHTRK